MKPYIRMVAEKKQKAKNDKAFQKSKRGRKCKAKSVKKFQRKRRDSGTTRAGVKVN